ncbi:MAG: hypothetical protein HBSAPP02_14060 [Phycisphaerae bacterium]|nr:MAG: hypothetical protein HRU71_07765 [Planctomycetia bacterium]RIK71262.1 MAG: hypothetical protein DCC66_01345 [Planctomycetota bacterium]GJQ26374.1 MAG: hypothetical protein HBSAPP02_14060 [Phycisphaerae bacterium]
MSANDATAMSPEAVADTHAWEKEFAPRITLRHLVPAFALYAAWMIFLAWIAVDRWTGALQ